MSVTTLKSLLSEPVPDLQRIHCSIPKFAKYTKLTRQLLKVLVKVWSEDEDSRRILALLCLLKLVQCSPNNIAICMKSMFVAYVRNSKFVLGSTLAHINFMRHSLIELFSLNLDEAYLHAFVYIRQLAIVLRKAYLQHSTDNSKAVQNWQFINSMSLWCDLVARHADSHQLLRSLLHPLVQILVGTIKLNPGERWIPLRFHCVSMLHVLAGVPTLATEPIDQSKQGHTDSQPVSQAKLIGRSRSMLMPSLPLLLDVFQLVNFNKHSSAPSKAPLDLRLLLHFSPSQRRETACADAVLSCLVDLLAECAASTAASVAFPEFVMPLVNQLKQFSRTCRVAAFTRQTKALQVKVREHSDWVCGQRRRLRSLANPDEIALLESQLASHALSSEDEGKKTNSSPFWSFYVRHKEVRAIELAQLTASHQKDNSKLETKDKVDRRRASKRRAESSEDDDDSASSDGSYDYDDGIQVTHVSGKNKEEERRAREKVACGSARKPVKKADPVEPDPAGSSSDSDFDLEAALRGDETDEETRGADALLSGGETADEVTDFEMSDSDPDQVDDDDAAMSSASEDGEAGDGWAGVAPANSPSPVKKHKKQKQATRKGDAGGGGLSVQRTARKGKSRLGNRAGGGKTKKLKGSQRPSGRGGRR